jgi:ubiquinone/menaquinone biosynthesis C-methylase UbiE
MKGHICSHRFAFTLYNSFRNYIQDPEKILHDFIRPGATVLDLGCGPGYFTIPMASMVGASGTVIAADIQKEMLQKMEERAVRQGVRIRIRPVLCAPGDISVRDNVDFILTFWMVHEVPDRRGLFRQLTAIMKPDSRYLLVEPKLHVTKKKYHEIVDEAVAAGLKPAKETPVPLSRGMLFSL